MQSPKNTFFPKNLVIILTKRIASQLFSIYNYNQSYDYTWLDVDFWRNLRLALSYAFDETDIRPSIWLNAIFTTVVELRQAYAFWWNGPQVPWPLNLNELTFNLSLTFILYIPYKLNKWDLDLNWTRLSFMAPGPDFWLRLLFISLFC